MKAILAMMFILLLPLAVATNASGGNYTVASLGGGLQAGNASGGNYTAQTWLVDYVLPYDVVASAQPPSVPSGSSGGGGGGGAPPINPFATGKSAIKTDARVWGAIPAGETLSYRTNLSFSAIALHFGNATPSARITITESNATPRNTSPAPGTIYRYVTVDHQGLAGVDKHTVELTIPKSWIKEQGIAPESIMLYRMEGPWQGYAPVRLADTTTSLVYSVTLPGFSTFAISGMPLQAAPVMENAPSQPIQPAQSEVEEPAEFVPTDVPKGFRIPSWLIIIVVVVVAIVGSVIGLQQYKEYQIRENKRLEQVRLEGEKRRVKPRPAEHDPMWQLHNYIMTQRAKGTPDDVIRKRLLSVGWDELVVEMEMMR